MFNITAIPSKRNMTACSILGGGKVIGRGAGRHRQKNNNSRQHEARHHATDIFPTPACPSHVRPPPFGCLQAFF